MSLINPQIVKLKFQFFQNSNLIHHYSQYPANQKSSYMTQTPLCSYFIYVNPKKTGTSNLRNCEEMESQKDMGKSQRNKARSLI